MTSKVDTILLHVATNTFFNTLFEYAKAIKSQNLQPLMYFDTAYPTLENDLQKLKDEGISFELDLPKSYDSVYNLLRNIQLIVLKAVRIVDYYILGGFVFELFRYNNKYHKFKTILKEYNCSLILMISDLVQYDTGLMIKAAHSQNLRVILFPLFAANYKEAAEHNYYNTSSELSRFTFIIFNKVRRLKKWVIDFKGKCMIRLPLHKILVREFYDVAPKNPWAINSGLADVMVVEGAAVKNLFLHAHNYDTLRIEVLGSVNIDKLYYTTLNKQQLLTAMVDKFCLDSSKKNVLVAIPADMHGSRASKSDFATYTDLVEFWLENLSLLTHYNVVLSVHPSVTKGERNYFLDRGFKILDEPTVNYIALFDLYIASISATIQWAITCGIPVINYDDYKYRYDDYNGLDAVRYVDNKTDFITALEQFNNLLTLNRYTEIQKNDSNQWGILDGNGVKRILNLIDNEIR